MALESEAAGLEYLSVETAVSVELSPAGLGQRDEGPSPLARTASRPRAVELSALSTLFGAIYFLQGLADPVEGIVSQPVRMLLKSWHERPTTIAAFAGLLALPWAIKPVYGLLTDFVPFFGYRRKSYLVCTTLIAAVGFLTLASFPPPQGAYGFLFMALLVSAISVAFCDVVVDALMVERGQPLGLTGRLQSVQWASIYAAAILTGLIGGYLSQHALYFRAFLLCGLGSLVTLMVVLVCVREPRQRGRSEGRPSVLRSLSVGIRSPLVRSAALFCLLFEFNPFSTSVLYLHMTNELRFSEQFYGVTKSIVAVASVLACVGFGLYAHRLSLRKLLHLSIVLGMLSTLVYLALDGIASACVVSFVFGLTYMTATLIQVQFAAQACPTAAVGTIFALVMALSNIASSLSTWAGGYLYEQGIAWWGQAVSFQVLLVVGAVCTATCWLVMPLLPRDLLE
jgi:MFS family permease